MDPIATIVSVVTRFARPPMVIVNEALPELAVAIGVLAYKPPEFNVTAVM
jgi:hypothetical protein